ncbi:hypothetical protein Tco_0647188, partial [Tanacetum coccineum]
MCSSVGGSFSGGGDVIIGGGDVDVGIGVGVGDGIGGDG